MTTSHPEERRILIVVGPGRSGTSTIAGSLAMTGMEVPGLAIQGNETNPSGFYEPRWVVDLHKELLQKAGVRDLDTSPQALERTNEVTASPAVRKRLRDWLAERLEEQPRLVVKDPRAVWFQQLWASTCGDLGVEPGYITMLRHPAEVAGSREKYYQKGEPKEGRDKQIVRIAGWVNVALLSEQVTEGMPRSFVRYSDLVADWRKILGQVAETHRLELEPALDVSPHPLDGFIDPTLHRVTTDWESVNVPRWLRDLGERTWVAMTALADSGDTHDRVAEVAEVRRDYAEYLEAATVLASQETRRDERARRQARRRDRAAAGKPTQARTGDATGRRRAAGARQKGADRT